MNIKKEFGEKIKRMRKKRKLTQEQLAEMVDVTPRTLSGIEIGANFVKAETLEKIVTALNTTTEELFANDHLRDSEILVKEITEYAQSIKNDRKRLEKVYRAVKFFAGD